MAGPWEKFASNDDAPSGPWEKFSAADAGRTWADVPREALSNAPKSAIKFARDLVQPILHPIETVKSFANVGYGLASKAHGALGGKQDPTEKENDEATVDAIGQMLKERYGGANEIKKTLATDPVGALGDASLVLSGGGSAAARVPGVAGRVGSAVATVGRVSDPLALVGRAAEGAGRFATQVLGTTSGTGPRPIQEAYAAGRAGNPTFTEHMRGHGNVEDIVDMAASGVNTMTNERRAAYNRDMAPTRASQAPVDMVPVRRILDRTRDQIQFRGIVKDPAAMQAHTRMVDAYNDFLGLPPVERTAEAMDAFKQSIGAIRESIPINQTNARRVAGDVYRAIGQEIRRQSPSYDAAMRGYTEASDQIDQIRRTLSVNDRAATDTTARKLTSVMRNNVNTNYGYRETLAEQLARRQPNLMPAIAGQSMNAWHPRGLAMLTPAAHMAAGAATMNPLALAGLPLASPRLIGEAAYGLGSGARVARNVADMVDIASHGTVTPAARAALNAALAARSLGLMSPDDPRNN